MKTAIRIERFICPECGWEEDSCVEIVRKRGNGRRRGRVCASCNLEIPMHLAERWGGISVEDAKKEWREVYRDLRDTIRVVIC